jgi:hypothetical protein
LAETLPKTLDCRWLRRDRPIGQGFEKSSRSSHGLIEKFAI